MIVKRYKYKVVGDYVPRNHCSGLGLPDSRGVAAEYVAETEKGMKELAAEDELFIISYKAEQTTDHADNRLPINGYF